MVQLMKSGNLKPEPETTNCRNKLPVKLEIVEDFLEEEHGPLNKRSKASPSLQQQWSSETNGFPIPPSHYDPLDEPSPLGLQLRKSTSLLDLIQMRLSQSGSSTLRPAETDSLNAAVKKESKGTGALATTDKLKASNFPASLLRIGQWEYKSRYEGDLVAKCYFAKHKLVWEVLEGGLKSKIEIQWSDIMALKANCPDDGPGTLNVVLARPPLFFRETNPQPRKHTLWQAAVDFTDGQASMHKQHFLQCAQGLLNKHFEKLIQCDTRLNFISRQPEIILDSPYFDEQPSVFQDPKEQKGRDFDQVGTSAGSTISSFQNLASPVPAQSSSLETDIGDPASIASEHAPSPSSVMDTRLIEGTGICQAVDPRGPSNWDQIKVTGLRTSMSVSDFVNHIGQCLSEQVTSGIPSFYGNAAEYQGILEEMTQYLLSDTQLTTASDEKSLMSRVNSLCCLLQKDTPTATNAQVNGGPGHGNDVELNNPTETMYDNKSRGDRGSFVGNMAASSSKQPPGMPRIDSLGDMLLQLPRIASIPKLLFNISEEDGDSQAR